MSFDHYRTLVGQTEHRIKVQRSEFVGIALPVSSEAAFADELRAVEKRFFDASHVCWAYRLAGGGESLARSADAGEPAGTAGKPILSAIEGGGFFDVSVLVVRYFGGTKLGTGGLSRAYRESARSVLEMSTPEDRFFYHRIQVEAEYEQRGVVYRMLSPPDILLVEERFEDKSIFILDVRRSQVGAFSNSLVERRFRFAVQP